MALDGVEFEINGGPEWARVEAALADMNQEFPVQVREALSEMVEPWVTQAQADVSSTPIKGIGKQTGLRREVAGSVSKKVEGPPENFTIDVESSLPHGIGEENEAIIPLGFDRPIGWRHPVFGNDKVWVQQVPLRHHWFTGAFDDHENEVANEIQQKLEQARDAIAAAGT